ncbi:hypothetical protein BDV93DRAFT_580941 [Ceratobasidium sp. AG-I]|nr:hypothetical protein BDV93DRAFT_580941 [Ceratobasidium sp. AG-I]
MWRNYYAPESGRELSAMSALVRRVDLLGVENCVRKMIPNWLEVREAGVTFCYVYSQAALSIGAPVGLGVNLAPLSPHFITNCTPVLIMRINRYSETYKSPGRHWHTEVNDLCRNELQRLEARLRRDESTAIVAVGASTVALLCYSVLMPPLSVMTIPGIVVSMRRGYCAGIKLDIVRKKLAERLLQPLPPDFLRDTLVPGVAGSLGPAISVGVADAGLTGHLAEAAIPLVVNPDEASCKALDFMHGVGTGIMHEAHKLFGHAAASTQVNVAYANVFSSGFWVGDHLLDLGATFGIGDGFPWIVNKAVANTKIKKKQHLGWWIRLRVVQDITAQAQAMLNKSHVRLVVVVDVICVGRPLRSEHKEMDYVRNPLLLMGGLDHESTFNCDWCKLLGARGNQCLWALGRTRAGHCDGCQRSTRGPAYYCIEPECKLKYHCEICMRKNVHHESHRTARVRNPVLELQPSAQLPSNLNSYVAHEPGQVIECGNCSELPFGVKPHDMVMVLSPDLGAQIWEDVRVPSHKVGWWELLES